MNLYRRKTPLENDYHEIQPEQFSLFRFPDIQLEMLCLVNPSIFLQMFLIKNNRNNNLRHLLTHFSAVHHLLI